MLNDLSVRHCEAISRRQSDAVRVNMEALLAVLPQLAVPKTASDFSEYLKDAGQRWVLFLDTLCRRGDAAIARENQPSKPVLAFECDIVMDGRALERPVNYALVRIRPPQGMMPAREDGRPWIIIDPRAGHGSGIGGFKSEAKSALP